MSDNWDDSDVYELADDDQLFDMNICALEILKSPDLNDSYWMERARRTSEHVRAELHRRRVFRVELGLWTETGEG